MSLTFLSPALLWTLAALPVVVLLHFLRTRRRKLSVSALFLWRRASEEASRVKRFSPTWLLLLQLLFVTLAALALARPVISLAGPPNRVIVVDSSASMAAVDSDGRRMDKAVEIAEELIAGAGQVAVVRAGLDAVLVSSLEDDKGHASTSLRGLEPGDREADLSRALDLAKAIAPDAETHLITDRQPPSGRYVSHLVAGDGINHGIVTFEIGLGQAYLAVASNDPRPQQLLLQLLREDDELARTEVLVPAAGQASVTFPLPEAGTFLEARLSTTDADALSLDDVAFTGQPSLRVAVEEDNGPVLRALEALPGTDNRVASDVRAATADVHVLFGEDPENLPAGSTLLFGDRLSEPEFLEVRDWAQDDPLFRFVDLRDAVVGLDPARPAEVGEGWEVLARAADLSPVISRRNGPAGSIVRFHFHPSQSDIVLRPAFPTLIANLFDYLRGDSVVPLGQLLPEGSTFEGEPANRATFPGIYVTPEGSVAASLLSAQETILPAPLESVGTAAPVVVNEGTLELSGTMWLVLLGVAAALLLAEWLAWSRSSRGWLRA